MRFLKTINNQKLKNCNKFSINPNANYYFIKKLNKLIIKY